MFKIAILLINAHLLGIVYVQAIEIFTIQWRHLSFFVQEKLVTMRSFNQFDSGLRRCAHLSCRPPVVDCDKDSGDGVL